jgi:hypothetical protein
MKDQGLDKEKKLREFGLATCMRLVKLCCCLLAPPPFYYSPPNRESMMVD